MVDLSDSYTPVLGITPLHIIVSIASVEGLTIFILDISNTFQNNILPNTKEKVYPSLPHLYLKWLNQFKEKTI